MRKALTILLVLASIGAAGFAGYWYRGEMGASPVDEQSDSSTSGEPKVLYWAAPMDANFRRDKPGKSPMGMDLVPVYEGEANQGDADVEITAQMTQNLGVRTAKAKVAPVEKMVKAYGTTRWDQTSLYSYHPLAEGWVTTLNVKEPGEVVTKGEVLYELFSPKLFAAQEEYLSARRGGRSLAIAAENRLRAIGFTNNMIKQLKRRGSAEERLAIRVQSDGIVTQLPITEGAFVKPQMPITTIGSLNQLWLEVDVSEGVSWIRKGTAVNVNFDVGPSVNAKVDYIYPEVDTMTRATRIRLILPNAEQRLRPNAYATAIFSTATKPLLQIPTDAIIRSGDGNRVMVALGAGQFKVQPIEVAASNGDWTVATKGISKDQEVVISGQFLLDAEANGEQALARWNSLHTAEGKGTIVGFPRRGKLRLDHEPIDALGWPSMNMVLDVGKVNLTPLFKGDYVRFTLTEQDDKSWLITAIEKIEKSKPDTKPTAKPAADDSNHMNHGDRE